MSTGTRTMVRMEEQMALLMQNLGEHCQQTNAWQKGSLPSWKKCSKDNIRWRGM